MAPVYHSLSCQHFILFQRTYFAISNGFEPLPLPPHGSVLSAKLTYLNKYPRFILQWILLYYQLIPSSYVDLRLYFNPFNKVDRSQALVLLPHQDSNPEQKNQNLLCYRYTIGQFQRTYLLSSHIFNITNSLKNLTKICNFF